MGGNNSEGGGGDGGIGRGRTRGQNKKQQPTSNLRGRGAHEGDVVYICIVNQIRYLPKKDAQTHGGFVCAVFSMFERDGQTNRSLVLRDWTWSVLDPESGGV